MTQNPKQAKSDSSKQLEDEELVNDSLGEETPADSTGLDSEDEVPPRKRPN